MLISMLTSSTTIEKEVGENSTVPSGLAAAVGSLAGVWRQGSHITWGSGGLRWRSDGKP